MTSIVTSIVTSLDGRGNKHGFSAALQQWGEQKVLGSVGKDRMSRRRQRRSAASVARLRRVILEELTD